MATQHNFRIKNGLEINGTERITSAGAGSFTDLTLSGDLALTGDLNITGDVNSISVTDLDVTDKTITLGKGQTESNSGGSGIVVDGSSASILWDEANDEFDFNKGLNTAGTLKVSSYETELASGHLRFKFNGGAYIDNNTTGQSLNFRVSNSSSIDTTAMTIAGDGKVGIGTTAPGKKLEVAGRIRATTDPTFEAFESSSKRGGVQWNTGSDYLNIFSVGGHIVFDGNGNNVGIGVSNPSAPLHIQTNDGTTNSAVNSLIITNLSTGTTTTGFGGEIRFQAERNNGVNQNTGGIRSIAEINSGVNISSGMAFDTSSAGANSEKLRISYDGKVGIGTNNPSSFNSKGRNLVVNSDGDTGITISANTSSSSTLLFADSFAGTGGTTAYRGSIEYDHATDDMIFHTAAAERVRILDTGEVGIGTDSPNKRLHVDSAGSSDIVRFANDSGSFVFGKTAGLGSLDMASDANFRIRHGSVISSTFTSSGDVLFGSTSNLNVLSGTPKIQVGSGTGHSSMQFYSGTGSVAALYFGDSSSGTARYSGYIEYRHNNDTMAFRANGTDQVVIGTNETKFTGRVELSNGKPIFSETDNGTHHYSHLCTGSFYQGSNQGVAINTNIPSHNVSGNNMFSFKIHGFAYDSTGGGAIDCTIAMYSGENGFHNNTYTAQNIPKQWQGKIRVGYTSSNKVVILLGDTDTTTNYEIAVSCGVQGFYGVDPDYFSGWTTSAFTSTSAYTGLTTIQPKETQMIGFAARAQGFTKTSGWSVISNSMTTVDYDFGGYLNTSNGRFTPLTRGMYLFSVGGYSSYSDSGGSARYAFSFAKNSSTQHISGGNFCDQDSPLEGHSRMIYMNGTSDYVELRMYSSIGGGGITLGHSSHSMWWEAHLINQSNSAVSWSI